jgi:processive 1,2-diacylglycerol beta-glucosyltransferase
MVRIEDRLTGAPLGAISEDQLKFLINQLEEESEDDHDYYINRTTIDLFEEQNADPMLVDFLRRALGAREEMEIQWTRE